ncbi:MAG: AraC family transcriptional regulator [Lachnospiraceae bacterium]|nr:AraC family transcriptional regulator [Lachnospiraceae bacterium]
MSTKRYDFITPEKSIYSVFKLLYISSAKYEGDWHSTLHTHDCSELFYVTNGLGQFNIEGKLHTVSTNDLVIVNPGVEHTETSLNANPLEYIVLGVEGLKLTTRTEDADDRFCLINFGNSKETIHFCLHSMLKEIHAKAPGYESICLDLMEMLIIHLARLTNFATTLAPSQKKSNRLCANIHQYISQNFSENLSLDALAQMNHVSKYYMVHSFTKEYGISPIKFQISCRIQESRQLLLTTDYSIAVISRSLGFSSPSKFSQYFRSLEHMSPTQYRKQNKKAQQEG